MNQLGLEYGTTRIDRFERPRELDQRSRADKEAKIGLYLVSELYVDINTSDNLDIGNTANCPFCPQS